MLRLADVFMQHGPSYLQRYGTAVLPSHVRAIDAITRCRTPVLGGHLAQCTECQRRHLLYHSCRHRACPQCGHDSTTAWLARQQRLLLPTAYYHVVFTLPAELRRLVRTHQRVLINVLFQSAFESLATLCSDRQWLGGRIGALAVLHTWGRTLEWHPHIHMLVPAGGLAPDGCTWLPPPKRRKSFLVPVRALSDSFRGRFLTAARRVLPGIELPQTAWHKRWVVFIKPPVRDPQRVLEYLGRYVHRTALSDKAIVHCDDNVVSFSYRDSRDHRRKRMTLKAHEFMRRFLQHVPYKGLHRVRAFGLLHPAHRTTLNRLQLLLSAARRPVEQPSAATRPALRCPYCRKPTLRLLGRVTPLECIELAPLLAAQPRAPPHATGSALAL